MRKLTTVALSTALAGGMVLTLAPTSSAATSIRSEALKIAAKQKGDRYKRGATGPNRFDCSGLVHFAYKKAGYRWKKRLSAQGQYNMSRKISASNRKVGDLVFIGTSKWASTTSASTLAGRTARAGCGTPTPRRTGGTRS